MEQSINLTVSLTVIQKLMATAIIVLTGQYKFQEIIQLFKILKKLEQLM